jgi:hypothetical protein
MVQQEFGLIVNHIDGFIEVISFFLLGFCHIFLTCKSFLDFIHLITQSGKFVEHLLEMSEVILLSGSKNLKT